MLRRIGHDKLLISFLAMVISGHVLMCSKLYANNCFYNSTSIDKEYFIQNTKFKNAEWNDELKEATVYINKEEQVKVKYYACEHFGLSAKLIIQGPMEEPSRYKWKEKIKWLGRQVLSDADLDLLLKSIENKDFNARLSEIKKKDEIFVLVEGSKYVEFIASISTSSSKNVIQISWYY